ncbi:MAG: DsbA family protein [Thiobacillaceae bacterium]
MAGRILWYFADPMCSWCWGFSPVIEQIRSAYADRLRISLVLGGLRPGTTEPLSPQAREDILHHWHQVHTRTGQDFLFDGAMPPGFIYDTEPACRAVACMADITPTLIFPMLKATHAAFYASGRDVTQTAVLADIAAGLGVSEAEFVNAFDSHAARHRTSEHFRMARTLGVTGFPTLVLQSDQTFHLITSGWQPQVEVNASIDTWLAGKTRSNP